MKINKNIITKINDLQKQHEILNNELLIFLYAISDKQITPFKSLILLNIINENKMSQYLDLLLENKFITDEDMSFIGKMSKTKVDIMNVNDYEKTIELVLQNLNRLNQSNIKVTTSRKNLILKLLKRNYTLNDIIMVNEYFYYQWHNNPDMLKYVRAETLYNEKFTARYEEASSAFNALCEYSQSIYEVYNSYISSYETILNKEIPEEYKRPVFGEQEKIVFWLKKGITVEDITFTIESSIASWKNKPDLIPFISLLKILDKDFEKRKNIAKNKRDNNLHISPIQAIAQWAQEN